MCVCVQRVGGPCRAKEVERDECRFSVGGPAVHCVCGGGVCVCDGAVANSRRVRKVN